MIIKELSTKKLNIVSYSLLVVSSNLDLHLKKFWIYYTYTYGYGSRQKIFIINPYMMNRITLPIKGMHCHSCEMIIESTVKKIPHVQSVTANQSKWMVEIIYTDKEPDLQEIQKNIEKLWYHIGEKDATPRFSRDLSEYLMFFTILVIIFILYMIIKNSGISFDTIINNNEPSLPIVLLIGLTAWISSCMALVGWLILWISAKRNENNENQTPGKRIIPQLYFNIWRILWFTLLGGLLGTFGSFIKLSATSMSVLTILVGIVMILLGINLTHISPRMSKRSIGLPKIFSKWIDNKKGTLRTSALITGVLTFFLPCGFTFAMQVYAISTGNFLQGALVMGIFALWTLPGLLSIWAVASFVKGNFAKYFYRFVGVLVLLLWIYNISNAYNIVKMQFWNSWTATPITNTQTGAITTNNTEEVIHMTYSANGLEPGTLTLQSGKKYKIIIDSQIDVGWCMSTILLPGLDNTTQFVRKGNTITFEFTANKTGEFGFVCAMGLSHNAKVVIQ